MTDEFTPEELESIERLESLKPTPSRSSIDAEKGKAAFLSQARQLSQPVSPGKFSRLNLWEFLLQRPRLKQSTLTIALIISFLFLAATSTVYAAQQSHPGDRLYPLKLSVEDARIALSKQGATALALHLDFAQERLDEMQQTTLPGDSPEIIRLKGNFQAHIQDALSLAGEDQGAQTRVQELIDEYDLLTGKYESDGPSHDDIETPQPTQEVLEDIEDDDVREDTPESTELDDDSESTSSETPEPEDGHEDRSGTEDDEPSSTDEIDEEEEEHEQEEEEEKD